jgi:hypothetical protein
VNVGPEGGVAVIADGSERTGEGGEERGGEEVDGAGGGGSEGGYTFFISGNCSLCGEIVPIGWGSLEAGEKQEKSRRGREEWVY